MKMKILATVTLLLTTILAYGQRGGADNRRSYEIWGLPDGDEVGDSLKIGIPLIVVGFLISYIFMWSGSSKEKKSDTSTNIGCFGIIVMAIGAFALFPLLTWIEYVFVNIISLGFLIIIACAIIYLMYSALTNASSNSSSSNSSSFGKDVQPKANDNTGLSNSSSINSSSFGKDVQPKANDNTGLSNIPSSNSSSNTSSSISSNHDYEDRNLSYDHDDYPELDDSDLDDFDLHDYDPDDYEPCTDD